MLIAEKMIKAYKLMRSAHHILIVAHFRPDGDALASVSALRLVALSLGKEVGVFCQNKNPDLFDYLPGFTEIESDLVELKNKFKIKENLAERFDLMIIADCGSLDRTSLTQEIKDFKKDQGQIIEFDHHPQIDDYADIEIRQPGLSSTAELIYNFIIANNIALTRDLADCILTGILTDTANFLYPSATEDTLKAAAATLTAGAHYAKIASYTLHNKDVAMIKMWGIALKRLQLNVKYQVASTVITRQDIKGIFSQEKLDKAAESDFFSGLAGFLSNVTGAKAIMLLYEDQQGLIKGSLRSTPNGFLVDKLARALGGGGHERASGFAIPGRLEKVDNYWQVRT